MEELEKDMKPRFIEDLGILRRGNNKGAYRFGLYECQYCGNHWEVITSHINTGRTKSCGCVNLRITHGLTHHNFYGTWRQMVQRCTNPKHKNYGDYAERGITVCEEWLDIKNFIAWAESTHPNIEGYTLDRIDNDKGYSPENCTWSDKTTQNINQRKREDNTSGYVGIYWNKASKKWDAKIGVNNKLVNIGTFPLIENAVQARDNYIIENKLPHKLSILNTGNIKG